MVLAAYFAIRGYQMEIPTPSLYSKCYQGVLSPKMKMKTHSHQNQKKSRNANMSKEEE